MKGEEMTIASRVSALRSTIPGGVKVVAVSKFHPVEDIMQAYEAGQQIFGESRHRSCCPSKRSCRGYRVAFRWALATQQGEADRSLYIADP